MTVKIDMEMPKSCGSCDFLWPYHGSFLCMAYGDFYKKKSVNKENAIKNRESWCPLKECK